MTVANDQDREKRILEALEKFEQDEHGGEVVIFTEAQAQALIEVAKWWMALRGVSMVGGAIGSTIKWFAIIIGAWIAIKAGFLDWIANNIGGSGS